MSARLSDYPAAKGMLKARKHAEVMLVLDPLGKIIYCDAAASELFGASSHQLLGRAIRALIPNLPLREQTPAYNLAYRVFWAAQGAWLRFLARDAQGGKFRLRVALGRGDAGTQQSILLRLRAARRSVRATLPRGPRAAELLSLAPSIALRARSAGVN